ncbi:YciI family protein [Leifsonia sp. NPDC077715]|uniref:YciI family protein n=1 Tax=Leifsonia sp. NPDC077715 TaxID=3155539 RepID=UPI00341F8B94
MALFAVIWTYTDDAAHLAAHKPAHGAFLKELAASGALVEAGAWADRSGALLIVRADSPEQVDDLLATDPYVVEGVVIGSDLHEWVPIIGALEQPTP